MREMFIGLVFVIYAACLIFYSSAAYAKGVYQTVDQFVAEVFDGGVEPSKKTLWLKGDIKQDVREIFARESVGARQRYWLVDDTSLWIFNEIGKELPITIGVVVKNGKLSSIRVLEYRESRGAEVRHTFFTQQFEGAVLDSKKRLSTSIDGISGATLSVWSMQRVARAALYLDAVRRR